jgi:hypothetical protein
MSLEYNIGTHYNTLKQAEAGGGGGQLQARARGGGGRQRREIGYRGTSLVRNRPPPKDPPRILGTGLR